MRSIEADSFMWDHSVITLQGLISSESLDRDTTLAFLDDRLDGSKVLAKTVNGQFEEACTMPKKLCAESLPFF